MISHIIEYFKLLHPLKRGKSIAVSDPDRLALTLYQMFVDDKKSEKAARIPQFTRVLISSEEQNWEKDSKLVKNFETHSQKNHQHVFNVKKLKIFLRFTIAGCASYFLYWSVYNLHIIWVPGEWIINTLFGGSYNLWIFYGAAIAIPAGSALISYFFGGKRWSRIHHQSKYTELFSEMGGDLREKIKQEYVKRSIRSLEEKARREKVEVNEIRLLLEEIISTSSEPNLRFARSWNRRFDRVLEKLSSEFPDLLRGEIPKLQDCKEELLNLYWQKFQFAPLRIVTPFEDENQNSFGADLQFQTLMGGFKRKAEDLKKFREDTDSIQQKIWDDLELLDNAGGRGERIKILEEIQRSFERMRNISGNFHFGDNPSLPHERGENLSDFYDRLYELFGRAKNDIRERKRQIKGVLFSRFPVKSESQQRKRISRLKLQVERLIGVETEHCVFYDRVSRFFSWWGNNAARSAIFSLILFFFFTSFLSFELLNPGQWLTTRPLRIGVKEKATQEEKLLSRGVRISRFEEGFPIGFGKRLFWHLPLPLTFSHRINFTGEKKFTAYRILGSSGPNNPWQKGKSLLAGPYNRQYYEVLRIDFIFKVEDGESWAKIDYDGHGPDRLSRDITSLLDEWQSSLFNFYEKDFLVDVTDNEQMQQIFSGSYFEKLCQNGTLATIIRYHIARSPLVTYQYGTVPERINPGIELILNELERREARIKAGFLEVASKKQELERIGEFRDWVKEQRKRVEEETRQEYSSLRKNPELLKRILEDPRANIQELKNFETVWGGIRQTMLHEYGMEKFKKIIEGESGKEKKQELLVGLKERINQNPYFADLINIVNLQFQILSMSEMEYGQTIQRRIMELSELI